MRAAGIMVFVTLAGSFGWVGCDTVVDMGGSNDAGQSDDGGGSPDSGADQDAGGCTRDLDCGSGFYCVAPDCLPQGSGGAACSANDRCLSGLCGVAGSGHCCTSACSTSDSHGCGATDCDTSGACLYPPSSTTCVTQACLGHTLVAPAQCDGAGSCVVPSPATTDCATYQCGTGETCAIGCGSNAGCSVGFCHLANHVCCPPYPGNQIEVDGTQGQDTDCCGASTATAACATISYAVSLAGEIASGGIVVHAANPPNGTDWVADPRPIQLSYGVILSAPGLDFSGTAGSTPIFTVSPFGAETTTSAVIEGSATQPVSIGIDSAGAIQPLRQAIVVNAPMTLFLLNASVHDSNAGNNGGDIYNPDGCNSVWLNGDEADCDTGILVRPGATLTLGTDGVATSGTVSIGDGTLAAQESVGIFCYGQLDGGAYGVINDTGSTANPSTWIQNQAFGMALIDGCTANLTSSPRFGKSLNAQGLCDESTVHFFALDVAEIYLSNGIAGASGPNPTKATISNAVIECALEGIRIDAFPPIEVAGDHDLIQYNATGVLAFLGAFRPTNSTFTHNYVGIMTRATGVDVGADLSGGGNQVTCNGRVESGITFMTGTGMNVLLDEDSSIGKILKVSSTSWNHWDAVSGHTQVWYCTDGNYTDCTCSGASSCPAAAGPLPPNADVVFHTQPAWQNTVSIDDSNGAAAANGCP